MLAGLTQDVLARCDAVAAFTEEPERITRTFLCEPMRGVHALVAQWMQAAGMRTRVDAVGNLIGRLPAAREDAPVLLIGSHLDSVPNAGRFDGVLGVVLGIAAVQALSRERLSFAIDVIGFSEEEGVRFRTPYLGSLAAAGRFDAKLLERTDANGVTVVDAIRRFGIDPAAIPQAAYRPEQVLGYLEVHIEQGPVLEALEYPLGVVEAIAGQSRLWVRFDGKPGHAGTLPMEMRQDGLTAASEFVLAVERMARQKKGLRGTVGQLTVSPGAVNVVPGSVRLSVDVRHARDDVRESALANLLIQAKAIARHRQVGFQVEHEEHHPAVPVDPALCEQLARAVQTAGYPVHRMVSGAGHDAAVMATVAPMALLFVRSPGGISHHPAEAVLEEDVRAALKVMVGFIESLSENDHAGVDR